jgi:hypothetical protein
MYSPPDRIWTVGIGGCHSGPYPPGLLPLAVTAFDLNIGPTCHTSARAAHGSLHLPDVLAHEADLLDSLRVAGTAAEGEERDTWARM